jgi:glycosyltransferase involved in cell wall biosynthesis
MHHPPRLLIMLRYGTLGASSRLRWLQYLPHLREAGFQVDISSLFSDTKLRRRYKVRNYRFQDLLSSYWHRFRVLLHLKKYHLVLIEKEPLPWFPSWIEMFLLRNSRYILDFDDAQFHRYDNHYSWIVRTLLSKKFNRLIKNAHLIISGNDYISNHCADVGATCIEDIPTVVDLARYEPKQIYACKGIPLIVWIGTPETAKFLNIVSGPLAELAKRCSFKLRVIGAGQIVMPGIDIELFPWTADTEASMISNCDIGIMPLSDTPWERGKCAYKLIQYMACAIPVVASPVGANRAVVKNGETGFFATSDRAWIEKLEQLLGDAELRQRLGKSGRQRVESNFCLQKAAPKLVNLITKALH